MILQKSLTNGASNAQLGLSNRQTMQSRPGNEGLGARLAGDHLNDGSQKGSINNPSCRLVTARSAAAAFPAKRWSPTILAATPAASASVRSGRYYEPNVEQFDGVMLLKDSAPTAVRPKPAIFAGGKET
ncbi:hypothetical protein [Rhizobium multihospitium]|uniref:hypothetical protein n=1 Tax=Rhizobium multihospitium TaxID=410764 RepID=UPI000B8105AA|nr:hypothetical protein [Rhizobium multihospitium]